MTQRAEDISIKDYVYDLPPEKIAAVPNAERSDSKLLFYNAGTISDYRFTSLPTLLPKNAVLLFNDTKVITARLFFRNEKGQQIEVFCLSPTVHVDPQEALGSKGSVEWLCMVGGLKKWKEPLLRIQKGEVTLAVKRLGERDGAYVLGFEWMPNDMRFYDILNHFGALPIPPYLNRESDAQDSKRYQTVYADKEGSVAAPTAGLHFTESVLDDLKSQGIGMIRLTLHVGAGTFKPVKAERMEGHHMHAEWMHVGLSELDKIKEGLTHGLICVGTTSLRALESIYWMGLKCYYEKDIVLRDLEIKQWDVYKIKGALITPEESVEALRIWLLNRGMQALACETQILIAPPYQLKMARGLITNFHQPQSTLLLLVAAVIGEDWRKVYTHALEHDFKFLSYGDSSLLLK